MGRAPAGSRIGALGLRARYRGDRTLHVTVQAAPPTPLQSRRPKVALNASPAATASASGASDKGAYVPMSENRQVRRVPPWALTRYPEDDSHSNGSRSNFERPQHVRQVCANAKADWLLRILAAVVRRIAAGGSPASPLNMRHASVTFKSRDRIPTRSLGSLNARIWAIDDSSKTTPWVDSAARTHGEVRGHP